MKRTTAVRNGLAALLLSAAISAGAAEKKHTFEDDVMPILRNRCLKCHNANDVKGGLDLSSFSAALRGGAGAASYLTPYHIYGCSTHRTITKHTDPHHDTPF